MSLQKFLEELRLTGRVLVARPLPTGLELSTGDEEALLAFDEAARADLAGEAPGLDMPAALWAARLLHEACQLLIYRDLGEAAVEAAFARPCPSAPSPATCWSADLTLRYLPDLHLLARGIAQNDPLVERLGRLAVEWPLSSVGMNLAGAANVSAFIGHPGLRQLYADRVIERGDVARLDDRDVREAVRCSLGGYPDLAPRLSRHLTQETPR